MARIAITGKGSFVGAALLRTWADTPHHVAEVSLRDPDWRAQLEGVDAVVHVAGIAHATSSAFTTQDYLRVNCDLAVHVGEEAERRGARQFIFLSTMKVFGDGARTGERCRIDASTPLNPAGAYADAKAQAEERLAGLGLPTLTVVRPPMMFGPGNRGNYPRLSRLVQRLPAFPGIHNERSVMHVDSFARLIDRLVAEPRTRVVHPDQGEYWDTAQVAQWIARAHGRRLVTVPCPDRVVGMLPVASLHKIFGSMAYAPSLREPVPTTEWSLHEAIRRAEGVA